MTYVSEDQAEPTLPQNKEELIERIDAAWAGLQQTLAQFTPAQMVDLRDEGGWSVKDHLAHLAIWHESLRALLAGRNRWVAMGLPENAGEMDIEVKNELLHERNRNRPLEEVLADFALSHAEVRAAIEQIPYEDLAKSYSHYQPEDANYNPRPVLFWVIDNTYEHYIEHDTTIARLLMASQNPALPTEIAVDLPVVPGWLGVLTRVDFVTAVVLTVLAPLGLLVTALREGNSVQTQALLRYWRNSSLLMVTVYLLIGERRAAFLCGVAARMLIAWSLRQPLAGSGPGYENWRRITHSYALYGAAFNLPLLKCALGGRADAFCQAYVEPAQEFGAFVHPRASRDLLGRIGDTGLVVFLVGAAIAAGAALTRGKG